MKAALVAAVFVLVGKTYAAQLPHYDVAASVDTGRGIITASVKVTLAASSLQAVNEFQLGTTYEVSSVSASPGALRYIESALGPANRDELLAPKREIAAKAGPMLGAGERTDAELYSKGALVLFDLENRIGRARLDQLFASLAPHPPATTADFMSALAAVAGAEEAAAFNQEMHR